MWFVIGTTNTLSVSIQQKGIEITFHFVLNCSGCKSEDLQPLGYREFVVMDYQRELVLVLS